MISEHCNHIFQQAINDYHLFNDIEKPLDNPYKSGELAHLLYTKCWIDTVQWHMEDEVRDPSIPPADALAWKRRIDQSNQDRTDIVEDIDSYFLALYQHIAPRQDARLNTESPAWAIDRLSILNLKIYHMQQETRRTGISAEQLTNCSQKLMVLNQQYADLSLAIDELIADIEAGLKYMKVYKQMKMYNDPLLNPVLYRHEK